MTDVRDECGVVAIYHLPGRGTSPLCPEQGPEEVSRLVPRMLLDIQNRGQLSAGFTTFDPDRKQLIDTYKELGSVSEVFHLNDRPKYDNLMREYRGQAAIGHVRYATCGGNDRSYAQPFERHHIRKHKWFSFAFNGQLANYAELREKLLADEDNYLARETDTEIIMHALSKALSREDRPALGDVLPAVGRDLRRGLQPGLPRCAGPHAGGPRPAGDQAAELCAGRTAVRRGQRERGVVEPGLPAGEHQIALARPGGDDRRRAVFHPALRQQSPPGPLFLRVGLLFQRRQHAGRPQRLHGPQGPGRRAGAAGDGAHRRGHDRGPRARHQQGRGRRHGLQARTCPAWKG